MLEALIKNIKRVGMTALASAFLFTPIDSSAQTSKNSKPGLAPIVYEMNAIEPITQHTDCPDWNTTKEVKGIKDGFDGIQDRKIVTLLPQNCTATIVEPIYTKGKNDVTIKNDLLIKTGNGKLIKNPNRMPGKSEYAFDMSVTPEKVGMKQGIYLFSVAAEKPGDTTNKGILQSATWTVYVVPATQTSTEQATEKRTSKTYERKTPTGEDSDNDKIGDYLESSKNNPRKSNKKKTNNDNSINENQTTSQSYLVGNVRVGVMNTANDYIVTGDPERKGKLGLEAGATIQTPNTFGTFSIDSTKLTVINPVTNTPYAHDQRESTVEAIGLLSKGKATLALRGSERTNSYVGRPGKTSSKLGGIGAGIRINLGKETNPGFISGTGDYLLVTENQNSDGYIFAKTFQGIGFNAMARIPLGDKTKLEGYFSKAHLKNDFGDTRDSTTLKLAIDRSITHNTGIIGKVIIENRNGFNGYAAYPGTSESNTKKYLLEFRLGN